MRPHYKGRRCDLEVAKSPRCFPVIRSSVYEFHSRGCRQLFAAHSRIREESMDADTRPWTRQEIASRFRALRRKALFTQSRLADLIGICRQAVNKIENARAMPHP